MEQQVFGLLIVKGGMNVSKGEEFAACNVLFPFTCTICASPDAQKRAKQHLSHIVMINHL